jgi:integrase
VRTHVEPLVGHIPLQKLTANDLDRCYAAMLSDGHQRNGGPLSPRSARFVHSVVRKALSDAMRKGMVTTNVADLADPPAHSACRAPEMTVWSPTELGAFLEAVADHEHALLFRVAAMTGLRRGELGGLRWRDLDLDAGMLTVRGGQVKVAGEWTFAEPKTQAGRRRLDIDPATVAALRRQRQALLERRMALGAGWSEGDLVFPGPTGGPADLDAWGKSFRRAIRDAGAPPIRLHDLRHSHASHLLVTTDVRTMSARLGHADPGLTLRIYAHVMPGRQAAAAAAVAALVEGGGR